MEYDENKGPIFNKTNEKVAVLIDNQYLLKLKQDLNLDSNGFQIGYSKLSSFLSSMIPAIQFRTYIYDALRPIGELKTDDERNRYRNYESFLFSLEDEPNFEVRRGIIQRKEDVYRQKQVDVWIAVDIVRLSLKRIIDHLVLVTGDADFVPAIKVAKEEGIRVHLWHAERKNTSVELRRLCDTKNDLTRSILLKYAQYEKL